MRVVASATCSACGGRAKRALRARRRSGLTMLPRRQWVDHFELDRSTGKSDGSDQDTANSCLASCPARVDGTPSRAVQALPIPERVDEAGEVLAPEYPVDPVADAGKVTCPEQVAFDGVVDHAEPGQRRIDSGPVGLKSRIGPHLGDRDIVPHGDPSLPRPCSIVPFPSGNNHVAFPVDSAAGDDNSWSSLSSLWKPDANSERFHDNDRRNATTPTIAVASVATDAMPSPDCQAWMARPATVT